MRTKTILCALLLSLLAIDADGGPFRGRQRRQERRAAPLQADCPGGVCPSPGSVPLESGGDFGGYKHLNPPVVAPAPPASTPQYEQRTAPPVAAVAVAPPVAPTAPPQPIVDASTKARIDALLAEFAELTGRAPAAPPVVVAPPADSTPPPPPVPPQDPQPTPTVTLDPVATAPPKDVIDDLGGVVLIVHDGTGKPVATAAIDFSEIVRQQIGAK